MTTAAAPRSRPPRHLTNTNTDLLCAEDGILAQWKYRFNLWTGLYMLNPYEQFVFLFVGFFTFTVSMAYFFVFWNGFREGLFSQSTTD